MDTEEIVREVAEKIREALDSAQQRAEGIIREAESEAERIRSEAEADARSRLDQVRRSLTELEAALGSAQGAPAAQRESPSTAPTAARDPRSEVEPPADREPSAEASDEVGPVAEGAARLVAMKLALDGTPRKEARERLAADYDVANLDSLLDEVYARAGSRG